MESVKYGCPRCGHDKYEAGEMRAAGGFWSKIFDVQARRFATLTCARCRHTELYEAKDRGSLENVFDFFTQ